MIHLIAKSIILAFAIFFSIQTATAIFVAPKGMKDKKSAQFLKVDILTAFFWAVFYLLSNWPLADL